MKAMRVSRVQVRRCCSPGTILPYCCCRGAGECGGGSRGRRIECGLVRLAHPDDSNRTAFPAMSSLRAGRLLRGGRSRRRETLVRSRERSYRCEVCRWQGQLEPLDAGDAAPCPNCGVYLYPLSWTQTWGVALL